jgi:hypothetical protein
LIGCPASQRTRLRVRADREHGHRDDCGKNGSGEPAVPAHRVRVSRLVPSCAGDGVGAQAFCHLVLRTSETERAGQAFLQVQTGISDARHFGRGWPVHQPTAQGEERRKQPKAEGDHWHMGGEADLGPGQQASRRSGPPAQGEQGPADG